ncbi:MAG: DEAD/DEAH box helicase [Betaproteobacteria bacterium]|nr:DEAD/DEAH box helicase [Betaproteobacteria bacterium]
MTTTSQASNSSESGAFELLDRRIQQWIWSEGWTELRDAQEEAIAEILGAERDVIISAATASGKTEAAFLPILTKLLGREPLGSVVYISPLKALINDQWGRLERLCESLDVPVVPWHGDISEARKRKFLRTPSGILLITPESVESLFVNRGHGISGLLARVQYLVVDELHAFIGTERGKQLQSLLHRMEVAVGKRIPRIALSATLGDMLLAADFLRSGHGQEVRVIKSSGSGELKLLLKGYIDTAPRLDDQAMDLLLKQGGEPALEDTVGGGNLAIANDLFKTLRGSNNLIFPNSRKSVELFTDLLRRKCEQLKVPNEFWPHHGSLSKEIREEAEAALKKGELPSTAICTTTLELGIDIGAVKSIAQIGSPPSVASLRQRLGRSGRRGEPAILRIYSLEAPWEGDLPINDRLRAQLMETVAMVQLLLAGWYEPPRVSGLHLSTLIQQILSLVAERGGVSAGNAWEILCARGPFPNVSKRQFVELLRGLGEKQFLMQQSDGLLLHGVVGERVVNHYDFYSAFLSDEEFRVVVGSTTLGTLPISRPLIPDSYLIFAGRRWKIISVDQQKKVVEVTPAGGGRPPSFDGGGGMVHDRVREQMRALYDDTDMPAFLDATAISLVAEARTEFARLELDEHKIVESGKDTLLFAWKGDWAQDTLALMFKWAGLAAVNEGIAVRVYNATGIEVRRAIASLLEDAPDEVRIAAYAHNKFREKWDGLLPEELLSANYASGYLDVKGARVTLERLT